MPKMLGPVPNNHGHSQVYQILLEQLKRLQIFCLVFFCLSFDTDNRNHPEILQSVIGNKIKSNHVTTILIMCQDVFSYVETVRRTGKVECQLRKDNTIKLFQMECRYNDHGGHIK